MLIPAAALWHVNFQAAVKFMGGVSRVSLSCSRTKIKQARIQPSRGTALNLGWEGDSSLGMVFVYSGNFNRTSNSSAFETALLTSDRRVRLRLAYLLFAWC